MGEVYRGRDMQLDRDVAIKFLPDLFAADPDRLTRFEREAKALAMLNHPNIAQIYGVETSGAVRALVMELVDGEDLAQITARGPVPLVDAVAIARQVAEALEAAHEAGIVHRDLKPANIRVRPDGAVKVLDFGLAKAAEDGGGSHENANSPTFTSPALTRMGVILGTAAYMAPEQARGRPVDKRADIWAFGCVLYEMLTGRSAFAEETVTDTIAAVMTRTPDLNVLPAATPAALRRLLERCLERDPRKRLRDIGEARIAFERLAGDPPGAEAAGATGTPRWRAVLPWALAALAIVAAAAIALRPRAQPVEPLPALTYRLAIPGLSLSRSTIPALSPDGRRIAYVAKRALWVRDLDQLEPRQVTGVEDPQFPFWSPDGRQIAYVHGGALWRIPVEGGRPVQIATMGFNMGARTPGGVWRRDGSIVFAASGAGTGLYTVAEQGGEMRTLLERDPATESDFHRPSPLPDGEGILFVIDRSDRGADSIGVLVRGERKTVLTLQGEALDSPVYSPTGHILYHRETTAPGVWAVRFSLERLEIIGDPFLVVAGGSWPGVTRNGTLVYADTDLTGSMQLSWVDARGQSTSAFAETFRAINSVRLSPAGDRVAAVVRSEVSDRLVTIFDLRRQTTSVIERLGGPRADLSWWGNDRVVIARDERPQARLFVRRVDGTPGGDVEGGGALPDGARDGSALVFVRLLPGSGPDLWHLVGNAPAQLLATPHDDSQPALSPDATLLAYMSNETGQNEVYLRPYPGDGPRVQVSSGGGQMPRWSPTGDRIYYRAGMVGADGTTGVMTVTVDRRQDLTLGRPQPVPIPHGIETYPAGFEPAPDGRLLVVRGVSGGADPSLVVMQGWAARRQGHVER
jgi:Tol biopolymer transport system component